MKNQIKQSLEDMHLDEPIKFNDSWNFLKKGRIKVIILYEDTSFSEYYKKMKDDYFFTIKKRKYLIVPECFVLGKYATIYYYYNNPMPIKFVFARTKISALTMTDKESIKLLNAKQKHTLANISLDSSVLNNAFNSNLINKMYQENGITPKFIIIILIVVAVITLLILHFTGVIDLVSLLSGAPQNR